MTLSMFMRQMLEADGSCQKAVNGGVLSSQVTAIFGSEETL